MKMELTTYPHTDLSKVAIPALRKFIESVKVQERIAARLEQLNIPMLKAVKS